jgi:hypothetical protein
MPAIWLLFCSEVNVPSMHAILSGTNCECESSKLVLITQYVHSHHNIYYVNYYMNEMFAMMCAELELISIKGSNLTALTKPRNVLFCSNTIGFHYRPN